MTREKLRYTQSLMADRTRSIPETCRKLGGIPPARLTTPFAPTARLWIQAAISLRSDRERSHNMCSRGPSRQAGRLGPEAVNGFTSKRIQLVELIAVQQGETQ